MKTLPQLLTDYSDAIKAPILAQRVRTPLDPTGYIRRHESAWYDPNDGMEFAIVNGIKVLAHMAAGHEANTCIQIGEDHYASGPFQDMARGLLAMLSTECGSRLDMGFCCRAIHNIYSLAGFTEEL